ncbi:DUF3347 domain-containing protein [Flavihumibacter petaseus]|uniref:DUF3347 domain-containing protein n=1 Tax=Flavihumibacter petaseus NBRC 106054 TaxID=1220578 RepID=A0A0E9N7Y1_9BACT|nr:DUF3347 domain-containing protein [Flavihumibacter petaseus]GAO45475.1 hypothetical protein FPE01S_05_01700 [Flavihumibacter petaseus NBRC 106054]
MKTINTTMTALTALIFMVSCGEGKTDRNAGHEGHDSTATATAPAAATPEKAKFKEDKLNAVYQHYIHLTTALTNDDANEASVAANAIEAGSKEMADGVTLAASAAKISSATDINAQREAYSTMSDALITLAKKSGLSSGELYIDFCPMALNDKGAYWISSGRKIVNPYFGEKMKTCGEVKDSIK